MKNFKSIFIVPVLFVITFLTSCASIDAKQDDGFDKLVVDSSMSLKVPKDFKSFDPKANPVFNFQKGYRIENNEIEVLYVLRPSVKAVKSSNENDE